jgi:hypothetical protein
MKLSPAGQANTYLATNTVISASLAAAALVLGGLFADFFASHRLTLAFTWTGGEKDVTVQVLNCQSWTFYFAITSVLGLYSLHRLSPRLVPSGRVRAVPMRHQSAF